MKRINMFDQENAKPVFVFITTQKRELIVIITEVLRSQFTLSSFDETENDNFNDNENKNFDNYRFASIIHFVKNVEFFDFDYENVNNSAIVNVDRHVFYKNVYIFDDRLKNLAKDFIDEQRMQKLILKYFRNEILK